MSCDLVVATPCHSRRRTWSRCSPPVATLPRARSSAGAHGLFPPLGRANNSRSARYCASFFDFPFSSNFFEIMYNILKCVENKIKPVKIQNKFPLNTFYYILAIGSTKSSFEYYFLVENL
jgi:hypothetical protein